MKKSYMRICQKSRRVWEKKAENYLKKIEAQNIKNKTTITINVEKGNLNRQKREKIGKIRKRY